MVPIEPSPPASRYFLAIRLSAVFDALNSVRISRMVVDRFSRASAIWRSYSLVNFFCRPPFLPRALAAASPSLVRCRIRVRSNSAKAPKMWKINSPAGVVVSMASCRTRKPMPC